MDQIIGVVVYLQFQSVELVGISWKSVKGTIEQGKINCQQKLYHHKKISRKHGQVNMKSD